MINEKTNDEYAQIELEREEYAECIKSLAHNIKNDIDNRVLDNVLQEILSFNKKSNL